MSNRKTLLASLADTVQLFMQRRTVGVMKTEHSVFIPSELMINQADETTEFIKVVRFISKKEEWHCPVEVEQSSVRGVAGAEFVMEFSKQTDFGAILSYISAKIK